MLLPVRPEVEVGQDAPVPSWASEFARGTEGAAFSIGEAADDLESAIHDIALDWANSIIVLAAGPDWPSARQIERLVASPPSPLLVLFNSHQVQAPRRMLVATNTFAPLTREERETTFLLATGPTTEHVDFLRVIEEDSEADVDELQATLHERVARNEPPFDFSVLVRKSRSVESGILEVLATNEPYDLVLVDAPRQGIVARVSERVVPKRLVRGKTPILLYSARVGPLARGFMGAWNVVYGLVPSPSEAERITAYSRVRRSSRGNADFHVLMALSVLIAAFGLLLDSPAVVIGAMIVAPLMQPVLGVGLGVATANGKLTRIATGSVLRGVVIAVAVACVIGWLVPSAGVTDELNARGQPTLLDLLVALASGAAGAYATARKGAASSAAGVAIAVALVPPLATAGIGISLAEESLAVGAALLFITNITAIGAMSAMMFLWMGFKPTAGRFGTLSALVQGLATLAAMVLIVAFFIIARSKASDARYEREVFAVTEIAVQGVDPDAELKSVALQKTGDILVVTGEINAESYPAVEAKASLVQSDVTRQLGRATVIRLLPASPD